MTNDKLPNIVLDEDYKTVQKEIYNTFSDIFGSPYNRLENDILSLTTEAFSYDVVKQRSYLNNILKGLFVSSAEGEQLDDIAANICLNRIEGSYPTASLTLNSNNAYDITIKVGTKLYNSTGENAIYSNIISDVDIILPAASVDENSNLIEGSVTCNIELQQYIESSSVKTELLVNPINGVTCVQTDSFTGGTVGEDDDKFRQRYYNAWQSPSTAGSAQSYILYTYNADNRVSDVVVYGDNEAVVHVYYYSAESDDAMQERIESVLNRDDIRPLTDKVIINKAVESNIRISATLYIDEDYDYSLAINNAYSSLNSGLGNIGIGKDISRSYIISLLMVEGVKDINFNSLDKNAVDKDIVVLDNIIADKNEILLYDNDAILEASGYQDKESSNG